MRTMPSDYWIEEHKFHNWYETGTNVFTVDVKIEHITEEQKERLIKFVKEMSNE